jgi:monoterpene epsilon-lactone hydrolase
MTAEGRAELEAAIAQLIGDVAEGDPTVAQQRDGYDNFGDLMPLASDAEAVETDLGGVPAMIVDATGGSAATTVLYLHGGGYVIGSFRSHQGFIGALSRLAGVRVAVPEYRLAPEHPFPAAVDDAVAAYQGLLAQGSSPADVVISGDSAGGGLGMATLVALRDRGIAPPAGAVFFSPWTDLSFTGGTLATNKDVDTMVAEPMIRVMAARYIGSGDPENPLISPVYADLAGLPRMRLHVGGDEILLDDSRRIAEHATAAGVDCTIKVWPSMLHVFPTYAPLLPEGHDAWVALQDVAEFIQSCCASGKAAV